MKFNEKIVIVTGSGQGIGKCVALKFAAEGAKVIVSDINENTLKGVVSSIEKMKREALGIKADVSNEADVKMLIDSTINKYKRIDVLVNNAGVLRDRKITEMTLDDWNFVIDVSLKGAFLCSKYVAPYMMDQKYGKIINISSRAYLGNPGQANYSSAKAGIIGLTRSLAKELGKYYINVNAVAPGIIETDAVLSHPKYEIIKELQIKQTPIPRIGKTEDVANAIIFFASDESSYITGDVLHISGGRMG